MNGFKIKITKKNFHRASMVVCILLMLILLPSCFATPSDSDIPTESNTVLPANEINTPTIIITRTITPYPTLKLTVPPVPTATITLSAVSSSTSTQIVMWHITPLPSPVPSEHEPAIAFTLLDSGMPVIYTISPDGSQLERMINGLDSSYEPVWSPDGRRIAFLSGEEYTHSFLFIRDQETGEIQQIDFEGVKTFTWSPEGQRIAFTTDPETQGEHYMHTDPLAPQEGNYFVFLATLDNHWFPEPFFQVRHRARVYNLNWSPVEDRILAVTSVGRALDTYVLELTLLGEYEELHLGKNPDIVRWNPTGQRLAYNHIFDQIEGNTSGLYIANRDGSDLQTITETDQFVTDIQWSPDGLWLAYTDDCCGYPSNLYLYNLQTGTVTKVTEEGASSAFPTWSADSKFLVYLLGTDDIEQKGYSLNIYSLETGETMVLVNEFVAPYRPNWRP